MEALFAKAVARHDAAKKTSVPWQPDVPHPQPYYAFSPEAGRWEEHGGTRQPSHTTGPAGSPKSGRGEGGGEQDASSSSSSPPSATTRITSIALYAWNVDFMLPHAEARMTAALRHLKDLISPSSSPSPATTTTAVIVFLQECTEPDLRTIAANPWVRARFLLTDLDNANWASEYYGTTTLVDRRLLGRLGDDGEGEGAWGLGLAGCFRVHYDKTRMERDVLFVDIDITDLVPSGDSGAEEKNTQRQNGPTKRKMLRVGNTHLESMALEPAYRPPQVALAARFMKGETLMPSATTATSSSNKDDFEIYAALLAGDLNAIQPFDRSLHSDNGLKDAYLELGGQEDSEEGYTWGQQAATVLRERFGCSRMDKVYYHSPGDGGGNGLLLVKFEKFGAGVELEDKTQKQEIISLGFDRPWITDHLGVLAEFAI